MVSDEEKSVKSAQAVVLVCNG